MSYRIKESFYSIQGEGHRVGRAAVFCRFSGCNLWSGKAEDSGNSSCPHCDTDFVGVDGEGGGEFSDADELAQRLISLWPSVGSGRPYLVFTGGEPLLQLDAALIAACKDAGFELGVETNGTCRAPDGLDWITVSPKPNAALKQRSGSELKLLYPIGLDPAQYVGLDFNYFYLQPLDDGQGHRHAQAALNYCLQHPTWRLSLQVQKILEVK